MYSTHAPSDPPLPLLSPRKKKTTISSITLSVSHIQACSAGELPARASMSMLPRFCDRRTSASRMPCCLFGGCLV